MGAPVSRLCSDGDGYRWEDRRCDQFGEPVVWVHHEWTGAEPIQGPVDHVVRERTAGHGGDIR